MDLVESCVAYSIIGVITITLNIIEIIIIKRGKDELKTYEQLLLNLAIGDLLVGISSVCYAVVLAFEIPFARNIFLFMASFTLCASLLILLLIGVDRLMAIRYPLKHMAWVASNYIKISLILIWVFIALESTASCITLLLVPDIQGSAKDIFNDKLPLFVCVACVLLTILYSGIVYTGIRRRNDAHRLHGDVAQCSCSKDKALIVTCVLVVATFILCTLPPMLQILLGRDSTLELMLVANSGLNPVVYFFKRPLQRLMVKLVESHGVAERTDAGFTVAQTAL